MSLHHYRDAKKMSQQQVADRLGVSQVAYGQWELGNSLPTVDRLPALAAVLGVSMDELVRALLTKEDKAS